MDGTRLLTLDVLAAVWPDEYQPEVDDDESSTVLQEVETSYENAETTSIDASVAPATTADVTVDLSKRCLSSAEIFTVLKEAGPFSRLDISHNPTVDIPALSKLLQEYRLRWINIDGCSISDEDMVDLLRSQPSLFRGVETVIHPVFLCADSLLVDGKSRGMPVAFGFLYQQPLRRPSRCFLPFFGVDQLVQNLLDVARVFRGLQTIGDKPSPYNMVGLLAASYRSGRPWASRDIQTIPLEMVSADLKEGYTLVVLPPDMFNRIPSPRGGLLFQYGVLPPSGAQRFIDMATFLERLKEDGWPKPTDEKAVEQVIKEYDEGGSLLADLREMLDALN